jgi:hypothetical protein
MNLAKELKDWEDIDVATYLVGQALGVFPDPAQPLDFQVKYKATVSSDNVVGNFLYDTIKKLVELGILQKDDDEWRVKWVKNLD